MDCCTDSAIKTCDFLQITFWACFVLYAATFYYIVQKKPWIKHHGLYINVFAFQMLVLLCKRFLKVIFDSLCLVLFLLRPHAQPLV